MAKFKKFSKFGVEEMGCYADGCHGHGHIRAALRDLLQECGCKDMELNKALAGRMSDDAWEEDAAIEYLNENCCDSKVYFTMDAGDLMLASIED